MLESFGAGEAARLAGLPYPVLDYWVRSSFVVPSVLASHGSGNKRRFSFSDLVSLRVAAELRREGVSLQSLRRIVDHLKERGYDAPLSQTVFVTDGCDVFEVVTEDEVVSVLRKPGQRAFHWIVDLTRVVEELRAQVAR